MASKPTQNPESGFALLISLIVVGVVLSVGLSMLDLTIKQVRLASNAKDSEIAFHAANAGIECARYWRREEGDAMEVGAGVTVECFDEPAVAVLAVDVTSSASGDGEVFTYNYDFTWGGGCSEITTLVASSSALSTNEVEIALTDLRVLVPGYPSNASNWTCALGERCTILAVRGYNKPCTQKNGYGVVEREVLLQF